MSNAFQSSSSLEKNPLTGHSFSPLPSGLLSGNVLLTDLFKMIFSRLHPLFSIDCGVILIYDQQITVIKEAYVSQFDNETEQVNIELIEQPSEITGIQKTIAGFTYPVLKTSEEWLEEENHNQSIINGSSHFNFHCYLPLEVDNNTVGTLELHNINRELSAECLNFCITIADLLAAIISLQKTKPAIIESDRLLAKEKQENNANNKSAYVSPESDQFILLKDQVADINNTINLDSFLNQCEQLLPLVYQKLKLQLDEIKTHHAKLEDAQIVETEDLDLSGNYPGIIGAGREMQRVFALMDRVADSESTVLILGETGTGKELIAKAIHQNSTRRDKTMIMVNCAAIPANLIESELFGHEKGAFTGATDKRIGKFELADKSTLFLDEIGELPMDLQVKLLRALQEKEIERVGGKTTIKTNVRVISATNRNLQTEVAKGRFRQDLYFRLNVFPIALPALRNRLEDLPLLAMHFLIKYSEKANKQLTGFTKGALKQMSEYHWPGNVREMEHLIERQVLLNKKPIVSEIDIPAKEKTISDKEGVAKKIKTIDENERDHIFEVLKICKGRISGSNGAARLLGVPATTLNSKIKRLGLNKKHF